MKNIVTNILGLVFIGLAIYDVAYKDWEIWELVALVVIGLSLFIFSNKTLQGILKSIIGSKEGNIQRASTIDPDRDTPDTRG